MSPHASHRMTWPGLIALIPLLMTLIAGCGNTEARPSAQSETAAKAIAVSVAPAA